MMNVSKLFQGTLKMWASFKNRNFIFCRKTFLAYTYIVWNKLELKRLLSSSYAITLNELIGNCLNCPLKHAHLHFTILTVNLWQIIRFSSVRGKNKHNGLETCIYIHHTTEQGTHNY